MADKQSIAIIDYGAGNLRSVQKALEYIGESPIVTKNAEEVLAADKIILPGVGSFGDSMARLNARGLLEAIKESVRGGTPFLGICLGLQLLFEESDESEGAKGLSILKGRICAMSRKSGLKIPHMGWNSLHFPRKSRLFEGVGEGTYAYFVHSYYLKAEDEGIVTATAEYADHIHAAVESGNIFACQFHPEKSGEAGLRILKNFASL